MKEELLDYMIYEVESFIYFKQKKVDSLIKEKDVLSPQDSIFIFRNFSESLRKISNILYKIFEIDNKKKIDEICDISLSTLGWIIFTLPSLEIYTSLFPENFKIHNRDIVDFLAQNMLEIENLKDNLSTLKSYSLDIADNLKEASMFFGYLTQISEKNMFYN